MLICIDIGNTNITIGGYVDENLKFTARLATDLRRTSDQYAIEIRDIIHIYEIERSEITGAAICSVVPTVGKAIERAVQKLFDLKPLMLGPGVKTGLDIRIDDPSQLGSDLVAGAVGTVAKYSVPALIVDLGTASTVFAIGKQGEFLGGAIAAGVNLTLDALTARTAQLPSVHVEAPEHVIGKNTVDCMKSGLVYGAAAMIDGLIDRMENEMGCKTTVVATGGLAPEIVKHCTHEIFVDSNLLLDGLRLIYNKNQKK